MAFRATRGFSVTSTFHSVGASLHTQSQALAVASSDSDSDVKRHQDGVQRSVLTQSRSNTTTSAAQPLVSQTFRRGLLQRLVAEAARKDWQTFQSAQSERPHFLPTTANQQRATAVQSVESLHRVYWQHVMKDTTAYYDALVDQAHSQPVSPVDANDAGVTKKFGGGSEARDMTSSAETDAYQRVLERLSHRRLWRSPVTSSVAARNFGDLVRETEVVVSNPMKMQWQQQAAQRRLLRQLPNGALFLPTTATAAEHGASSSTM